MSHYFQTTNAAPIQSTRCQFDLGAPTDVPRVLMAGEYPPTGSRADAPHANPTSALIARHIGRWEFDWRDIVPYAPHTQSGQIDRRALFQKVRGDRAMQSDWISHIHGWVVACSSAGMVMPVVYVAGDLCNVVWSATAHERFTHDSSLSMAHVYKTNGTGTKFLVMLDQPHPSWVLVSHGDPAAVAAFGVAMRNLKGLLGTRERATLDDDRVLATINETERLRLERRRQFMERIGTNVSNAVCGHFRDAPYDDDEYMEQLDELLGYGLAFFFFFFFFGGE
jgi:hypothetical protein